MLTKYEHKRRLSLSSDTRSLGLHGLGSLLRRLSLGRWFGCRDGLLGRLRGTLLLLGRTDGLLSLGLSHLRLHVSLGQDVVEGGTDDGSLKLCGPAGALLCLLHLNTLLVLSSVQHRPSSLSGVAAHQMGGLAFGVHEGEHFPVDLYESLPVAGVDFVAAE